MMNASRRALLRALTLLPAMALAPRRAQAFGFTPPDASARAAALGSLNGLSPPLRAAFTPDLDDLPIPRPGPNDWLAQHREAAQGYATYLRGGFNRPSAERRTIVVVPLGELGEAMPAIDELVAFVGRYFQLPARSEPAIAVEDLGASSRKRGRRRQYLTGDLLRALRRRLPADAYCLIGVTAVDLYPGSKWNFVFGEARFRDRVGVHSFARYDPAFYGAGGDDRSLRILVRGLKVMAHEIGHMFAISHCVHHHCVMNGTNHIEETDRAPLHLCPVCRRKLHAAVGYDPSIRESALAEFCEAHGLGAAAERYARRSRRIAGAAEAEAKAAEVARWLRGITDPIP